MPIDANMFGMGSQQDPSAQQGQSGINFGLIAPQQQRSGAIAQIPVAQGAGDGGIGELLGGLKSLVGLAGHTAPPDGQSSNTGVNPSYSPQSPYQALNHAVTPSLTPNMQSPYGNNSNSSLEQSLFGNANKMMGVNEHDPIMKNYLQKANPGLDPSVTPWSAGFVGSVLNASGVKGTGSLAARSYLGFGTPTTKPTLGDVVVLSRGSDQKLGHVGFYAGTDQNGNVKVLGGNHNDEVGVGLYSPDKVLGYRVPPSGQQVAQYAQQNNIQNPNQLASLTKGSNMNQQTNDPYSPQSIVNAAKAAYPNNPAMAKLAASQAFLESGLASGKPSGLAQKNNLFGIKGVGTDGTAVMPTTEYINGRPVKIKAGFAANKSIDDSFKQHADLMAHPRYQGVSQAKTLQDAAQAVQKAGYATDPNYSKEIQRVYDQNLSKYFDGGPQAMNSRALPGTGQVPIRELHPEDIQAIMNNQSAPSPNNQQFVG